MVLALILKQRKIINQFRKETMYSHYTKLENV